MASRTGTVADEPTLVRHGAIELPEKAGIVFKGWTFRTSHAPIVGEQGLLDIAGFISRYCGVPERSDDSICVGQSLLHLPPVIFGSDILDIAHSESGNAVSFFARDALACWAHKHTNLDYKLHVPKVPYAKEWAQRHKSSPDRTSAVSSGGATSQTETMTVGSIPLTQVVWDWTYTTDYCCSIQKRTTGDTTLTADVSPPEAVVGVKSLCSTASTESIFSFDKPQFRRIPSSDIDSEMLRQRQDILFYDEVILYEDDLEDCGEVSMNLKIRVMPSCWFVLSRIFTRVDGSLVSIRDARFFHVFGTNKIYLDISWQEQKIDPISMTGSDSSGPVRMQGSGGEAVRFPLGTAGAGGVIPPSDIRQRNAGQNTPPPNKVRDPNAWTPFLTDVTLSEGLHKNFELTLQV